MCNRCRALLSLAHYATRPKIDALGVVLGPPSARKPPSVAQSHIVYTISYDYSALPSIKFNPQGVLLAEGRSSGLVK
jgi:hypothetical protein